MHNHTVMPIDYQSLTSSRIMYVLLRNDEIIFNLSLEYLFKAKTE